MEEAIFLNGVFESVLTEIIEAQRTRPERACYLQPYASRAIVKLRDAPPTEEDPVVLYISTTRDLSVVSYRAMIVGWENKQDLSVERLGVLNTAIKRYQPGEKEIYLHTDGRPYINLISVRDVKALPTPITVDNFRKSSNGTPLKPRATAGGWSYVTLDPNWDESVETITREVLERKLESGIKSSSTDTATERRARLARANRLPARVNVLSMGFRRNPDVVVEVLLRAEGKCERCGKDAPFLRAKDGSPYLEVHHWQTLANGGEDVPENAAALCPNCHREVHYGTVKQ